MYKDPILKKYMDLIKGIVGNDFFKSYFYGDPIQIPTSNLPALVISKNSTKIGNITNREDEHAIALTITVVTDIRNDINDDNSIAPGVASLYDIIEGREDNLKLKVKSILHILRNNIDVDLSLGLRTDLGSITNADYGMTVGKRQPEAWSVEAQVEFIASFTQLR